MGLIDAITNKAHQGILGAKAIQPYIAEKYNGLTSAIHNKFNNFIDNVKGIPTLINDAMDFPTFVNDVKNAMSYAHYEGLPEDSYFERIKKGYKLSKLDRTDPIFHHKLRQRSGKPPELPTNYDLKSVLNDPRLKRILGFRKLISPIRTTATDHVKQSKDKNRHRKKQ